jgi:hypothetical protein
MLVQGIPSYNLNFQYSSPLKTLWRKGKLPVKYGFYGDVLTQKNVSLEHLKPHSKKGKTNLANLVLASKAKNNARGDNPIDDYLDVKNVIRYLAQFKDVKLQGFDGNKYIAGILATLGGLINVQKSTKQN